MEGLVVYDWNGDPIADFCPSCNERPRYINDGFPLYQCPHCSYIFCSNCGDHMHFLKCPNCRLRKSLVLIATVRHGEGERQRMQKIEKANERIEYNKSKPLPPKPLPPKPLAGSPRNTLSYEKTLIKVHTLLRENIDKETYWDTYFSHQTTPNTKFIERRYIPANSARLTFTIVIDLQNFHEFLNPLFDKSDRDNIYFRITSYARKLNVPEEAPFTDACPRKVANLTIGFYIYQTKQFWSKNIFWVGEGRYGQKKGKAKKNF